MDYELAKELKEAGFPEHYTNQWIRVGRICGLIEEEHHKKCKDWECNDVEQEFPDPTLSELIEACISYKGENKCGDEFFLTFRDEEWKTGMRYLDIDSGLYMGFPDTSGKTPEEAVARLWLALNKK